MAQLLSNLPVGAKVKDAGTTYYGKPIVFQVAAKNHAGYPANSVTLLTERIITLKSFDAKEPNNSDSNRRNYGNNRYLHSNIRQWLNKDSSPWYSAQHGADQAPNSANVWDGHNPYDNEAGFLANFSPHFKNRILTTTLTVVKNTVTDGGGSETVQDKVFLPSTTEVGLENENNIAEGSKWPLFTNDASRRANPTPEAVSNSSYTDSSLSASQPWYWWLRTPSAGGSLLVRYVDSDGSRNSNNAYRGDSGVRPALNLPSEISVSETPDSDGAHVIIWNTAPTISGNDENLGEKFAPFSIDYTVNDTDLQDTLTITEKVNDNTLRTINNAVRNQTYTLDLTELWASLVLGNHTITITVDDGQESVTRTYTFTKKDDRIIVYGKNPIKTSIPAKEVVVTGIVDLAPGATLTVYACNNAFDKNPTWEDVTQAFLNKEAHHFTNNSKTATDWGVNYRIELLKNNSTEKSYIEAVGVNFGMTGV